MTNKVKVLAKAQNRTALGIVHAYMLMYPQSTLEDLRKAFPNELNPDKGTKENFIPANEKNTDPNWDGYFRGDDELLVMGDSQKVSVVKMWTKPSCERIINHAIQFDIEVESIESLKLDDRKKGFCIEYLNGYTPKGLCQQKHGSNFICTLIRFIKRLFSK